VISGTVVILLAVTVSSIGASPEIEADSIMPTGSDRRWLTRPLIQKITSSWFATSLRPALQSEETGGTEGMSDMGAEPADALDVLRDVWRSRGQSTADLEDACGQKSCKRMDDAGVGFDNFAAGDEDLTAAWRARLAREGKLNREGGTIRDLVLGSAEAH
jgi:hypothetical protein